MAPNGELSVYLLFLPIGLYLTRSNGPHNLLRHHTLAGHRHDKLLNLHAISDQGTSHRLSKKTFLNVTLEISSLVLERFAVASFLPILSYLVKIVPTWHV